MSSGYKLGVMQTKVAGLQVLAVSSSAEGVQSSPLLTFARNCALVKVWPPHQMVDSGKPKPTESGSQLQRNAAAGGI